MNIEELNERFTQLTDLIKTGTETLESLRETLMVAELLAAMEEDGETNV